MIKRKNFKLLLIFSTETTVTDYLIYLNPTQSEKAPVPSESTIETNFDMPANIILFEDVACTINEDKTEWLCQCCQEECDSPGHHNGGGDKDGTTTTTSLIVTTTTGNLKILRR
jgi:hypothetical protein